MKIFPPYFIPQTKMKSKQLPPALQFNKCINLHVKYHNNYCSDYYYYYSTTTLINDRI